MIGQTISHFHILEKSRPKQRLGRGSSFRSSSGTGLGEGGMSPARTTVRSGGQNGPRTLLVSGCRFEDPRLPLLVHNGGQAPSFLTAVFVAVWRRCAS